MIYKIYKKLKDHKIQTNQIPPFYMNVQIQDNIFMLPIFSFLKVESETTVQKEMDVAFFSCCLHKLQPQQFVWS